MLILFLSSKIISFLKIFSDPTKSLKSLKISLFLLFTETILSFFHIPVLLSKVTPINVWANSFAFWVWCRGEMSDRTKRHETIHYLQQRELLMVVQWVLYGLFHIIGLIRYRDGQTAYYENPFEREAYANDENPNYLKERKPYAWINYLRGDK